MDKQIWKYINIVIFVLAIILFPFFIMVILFGLSGANPQAYFLIGGGYFGILIAGFMSLFKQKFMYSYIIFFIFIIFGVVYDNHFWENENNDLCNELRKNPTCVESECGFRCTNFGGDGFSISGFVCKDKDMSKCGK